MAEEAVHAGYEVLTSSADGTGVEGARKGPPVFDVHAHVLKKIYQALFLRMWMWKNTRSSEITVHIFSEPQFWVVLWMGKRIVSVGTLCGTYVDPKQHGSSLLRWLFRKSLDQLHTLVAISEYTRSRAPDRWRGRMSVIPLGVSDVLLSRPWKKVTWKEDASMKILSVGAVKPRKGFLELIRGFYLFAKDHKAKNPVLCIAGSFGKVQGEYVQTLQKTISDLGLTERVLLAGEVSDEELYGWYRWCDGFALTTIDDGGAFEGFGLVYLEANVFGKPCLGVASTGASQAISSESGIIIPSVGEGEVARGLNELFSKHDQLNPAAWAKKHSWARVFAFYESFYR